MIRLIAATDVRRGIATDTGIPWSLPGDAAYFRERTRSGRIVMGRATYAEFASPLHDRDNYVLTHDDTVALREGFVAVSSLDDLPDGHGDDDVWVIGGAAVYAATIDGADELLVTRVLADFHCTKFFPPFEDRFALASEGEEHREGGIGYRFQTWRPAV